jgi:hypothetical protein
MFNNFYNFHVPKEIISKRITRQGNSVEDNIASKIGVIDMNDKSNTGRVKSLFGGNENYVSQVFDLFINRMLNKGCGEFLLAKYAVFLEKLKN